MPVKQLISFAKGDPLFTVDHVSLRCHVRLNQIIEIIFELPKILIRDQTHKITVRATVGCHGNG